MKVSFDKNARGVDQNVQNYSTDHAIMYNVHRVYFRYTVIMFSGRFIAMFCTQSTNSSVSNEHIPN